MIMTEVFTGELHFDPNKPINVYTDDGIVVGQVVAVKRVATTRYGGVPLTEVAVDIFDDAAKYAIIAYAEVMRPVLHMWFDRPDPLTATFDGYA